ncbi:MAG: Dabb family protein [Bacteroidales bacterium]
MKEMNLSKRRTFLKRLGGLAAILALPAGLNAGKPDTMKGNFVHAVFFWLINEDDKTKKAFLTELRKFIDHVDMIKSQHIGTPAGTDRPVIDNSWTFSLILSFDSKKEQDEYQEHQLHKDFIANASSLWDKVLVYDSILV